MTKAKLADSRILVSTDCVEDGEQVVRVLQDDFANIQLASRPERAAADFEACLPDVLVLAFDKLESAQRYYLGIYRHGRSVHAHPHRTVLLCNKDEVRAAFELCKKDYFDDYVLHWPHAHDGRRLSMSVWIACREHSMTQRSGPPGSEVRAHARPAEEFELTGDRELAGSGQYVATATGSLLEAERQVNSASAVKGAASRALLMAVEDDELTRKLISLALDPTAYEIRFVGDAQEALSLLRRMRPDVILMDIRLPGIDGVSLTERVKASPSLAHIPIIMMSGDSRVEMLERSMKVGAAAFVVKPFTRQSLTLKLEKVLTA